MSDEPQKESADGGVIGAVLAAEFETAMAPVKYMGRETLSPSGIVYEQFDPDTIPKLEIDWDEGLGSVFVEFKLPDDMFLGLIVDGQPVGLSSNPAIELDSDQFFAAIKRLKRKESDKWR